MNWNLVALEAVAPQPWRNGGGTTRELLAWPGPLAWQVRMSVADVHTAGPFSRFDGIERWFAVLEGDGLVLRSAYAEHHLSADSDPFRFDGSLPLDGSPVRGPTRDFNLMVLPGRGRMQRVRGTADFRTAPQTLLGLYCHGAGGQLRCAGQAIELPPYHLAWTLTDSATAATVQAEDALWMEALA
jgi:environmental stress-induced protein Ves